MSDLNRFLTRLFNSAARRSQADRLREEVEEHLALQTAENLRAGISPVEARRQARLKFGSVEAMKEDYRDEGGLPFLENLTRDMHFAIRMLRKSPGFTVVAILSLGLGIGANTTMFSIVNSVLLRPLAYPESGRLVRVFTYSAERNEDDITFGDFLDWRSRNRSFESFAAAWQNDANLLDRNGPEKIRAACATADLFTTLRVRPILGRLFRPSDDRLGYEHVALLSYGFWQRRYGGDPSAVGMLIAVDSTPYTVVGILPRGLHYPGVTDVWLPMGVGEAALIDFHDDRRIHAMETLARLRSGVTFDQAAAEMNTLMAQLAQEHPATDTGWHVRLRLLEEETVGSSRRGLLILMSAAGLVLLIACANLAGLSLARSAGRAREFVIRGALGGSRSRLVRQLLTESILLGIFGGTVGAALSYSSYAAILALIPRDLPRLDEIHLDAPAFIFAFAVSLSTAVGFGLAPAIAATRLNLQSALKSGSLQAGGVANPRMRRLLIIGEFACAVVLLNGAALLLQSFLRLLQVHRGYNPRNVLTATIGYPDSYPEAKQRIQFAKRVLASLKSTPGVRAAAGTSLLPLVNFKRQSGPVQLEGERSDRNRARDVNITVATPDFFAAMQVPLISGRVFNDADTAPQTGAVVISETAARNFWPGKNPLGRHLYFNWYDPQDRQVVGVVGDVKQTNLAAVSQPEIYLPFYAVGYSYITFIVRTDQNPAAPPKTLTDQIHRVDGTIAVYDVQSLEQMISDSVDPNLFYLRLVGTFGLAALALAAVGIYGLISFSVAQRTREMGIRLALGAVPRKLQRMVVGEGLGLAAGGLAAGIAVALALGRGFSALLYGISPADPLTLVFVALTLIAVALAACYLPARRAMRVDPVVALRYE